VDFSHNVIESYNEIKRDPGEKLMKEFITVLITIFLSEIGDKTQLAVFSFATKSSNLFKIWLAATLAFCITNFIGIIIGGQINKFLPYNVIKYLAGTIFIIIGITTIFSK